MDQKGHTSKKYMKAVQRRAEGSNLTFSQKKGENDRKLQFSEHIHEKI